MGRGGRGRGGASDDPTVQNEVRESIKNFMDDPNKSTKKEIRCDGVEVRNTYKYHCKQMGVGWTRGSRKGSYAMIRIAGADPAMTLWKKVWCFYFRNYCDVDLIAGAKANVEVSSAVNVKPCVDDDIDMTDMDETAAILRLQENNDDSGDDGSDLEDEDDIKNKIVLDSTSNYFDGKRMWAKVRDLLMEIKRNDNQLWEECCSLGVNNCSERKVEPYLKEVNQFFDLQGRGPNQKIRGKKLRVEVGGDESVHFLEAGDNLSNPIEYAKPVKFCDAGAIIGLIRLIDKANRSLGADNLPDVTESQTDSTMVDENHLPFNIFNDNWRRTRRNFDLGERPHNESTDPLYIERKNSLRKILPAFKVGNEFCKRVFENDVVILCGATGCGKTTQLPQMLMEAAAKLMREQHSGLVENSKSQFGTGRIVCTQPRRISATSVAERVCFERNEKMGDRVGYQIRFEKKASDTTELLYCTTGILLRFLVGNPKLEGISAVIMDEIHERGVHSDFVLLILKDLVLERQGTAEPLKIVLMSATIDASNFVKYFDPDSKIRFNNMTTDICGESEIIQGYTGKSTVSPYSVSFLQIEGKTNYPIYEYFIEDICREIPSIVVRVPKSRGRRNNAMVQERNPWASADAVKAKYHELGLRINTGNNRTWKLLSNILQRPFQLDVSLVCEVVEHIETLEAATPERDTDGRLGSILIFVPGWQDITSVIKGLEITLKDRRKQHGWARNRSWNILPLHSMVPQKEQMRIFNLEDPHSGRRKIIVSTVLAETSVTVEDVVYVVDPGLTKSTTYSAHTNIASLETLQISRSNAQQRRGRAGRCRPGKFFKLYSQYEYLHEMSDHELPEMLRTPVEELCLQAKALRLPGDLSDVLQKAIDPPSPLAVENAVQLLTELGAFDANEHMTPLGWKLSQLPVHPCLGKMLLLGSMFARYSSRKGPSSYSQTSLLPLISMCSTLSFKSPFVLPFGREKEADRARKSYGQGLFSDHFLFAKVTNEYKNLKGNVSGRGELAQWLDKNYLSKKTLEMTKKMQHDLERHMKDLKVNDTSDFIAEDTSEEHLHIQTMSKPLMFAILAASLSISFSSPNSKKLCSLRGGSACSVHPSSLLSMIESAGNDKMLWRKYKHLLGSQNNDKQVEKFVLDYPDKIFIVGWFERLKTTEVYLRDCTLFSDPLPLLLLLPGVTQRGMCSEENRKPGKKSTEDFSFAHDSTIFEVLGGKSSQCGDSRVEPRNGLPQSTLLLKVQDVSIAQLLNNLRTKLSAFFGAVLSKGLFSNLNDPVEAEVGAVFHGLVSLIEKSYSLYMTDDGIHSDISAQKKDPDVLEVIHLHHSAHCEVLDPKKDDNSEDSGGEMDVDDDDNHRNRDSTRWRKRDKNRNSWHGDRVGASKGGRGRNGGRHGGAERDKGSRR